MVFRWSLLMGQTGGRYIAGMWALGLPSELSLSRTWILMQWLCRITEWGEEALNDMGKETMPGGCHSHLRDTARRIQSDKLLRHEDQFSASCGPPVECFWGKGPAFWVPSYSFRSSEQWWEISTAQAVLGEVVDGRQQWGQLWVGNQLCFWVVL